MDPLPLVWAPVRLGAATWPLRRILPPLHRIPATHHEGATLFKPTHYVLASLIAVIALASFVSSAVAARISTSGSRIVLRSLGKMTFEPNIFGFGMLECRLSLEGTLHNGLLEKVSGILLGYITRASFESCSGGVFATLTENLPWHIRYAAIAGTLPSAVTSLLVMLVGFEFQFESAAATCLYGNAAIGGSLPTTKVSETTSGVTYTLGLETLLTSDQRYPTVNRIRGPFNCPMAPTLRGSFAVENAVGSAVRLVRLKP